MWHCHQCVSSCHLEHELDPPGNSKNKEQTLSVAEGGWIPVYTPSELLESFVVNSEIFLMENFRQMEAGKIIMNPTYPSRTCSNYHFMAAFPFISSCLLTELFPGECAWTMRHGGWWENDEILKWLHQSNASVCGSRCGIFTGAARQQPSQLVYESPHALSLPHTYHERKAEISCLSMAETSPPSLSCFRTKSVHGCSFSMWLSAVMTSRSSTERPLVHYICALLPHATDEQERANILLFGKMCVQEVGIEDQWKLRAMLHLGIV